MNVLRTPEQFRTFFRGEPAPGERKVFTVQGVDFPMRWIPAGRFLMGAGADDAEAFEDEKPQREVTITQGFWMGETPVTQSQYRAIMGYNPSRMKEISINAPVETVSWYDATAFAKQVDCRLPTEAEWEYACRAGTTIPRYGALDDIAWCGGNSGKTTHPVGQKEANAWGLKDMLGNVWEWCYDVYGNYEGMGTRDPLRTNGGAERVRRGGSWHLNARYARSAFRGSSVPTFRGTDLGFRLVRNT